MRVRSGICAAALGLLPQAALAHSPFPGIEGFYTGLLHPFSTPSQALLMFGTGILIGSARPGDAQWCFGVFLLSLLIGMAPGIILTDPDGILFAAAGVTSAVAALSPKPVRVVPLVLTAIAGVLIGQLSITDPGPVRDRVITTAGSFIGAGLGLLYIFGAISYIRERFAQAWVDIAIRISCAWLGAISLVMLALSYAVRTAPL